ncbi:hypothetical protein LPJ53_002969 [Coemansia erecta]|uniref:Myb-like domain-containing protein n=1 Tax=Coemansia erecta TaxID=147472 RepID=A0A9W7Y2C8_9FUNG|nr:hypothetical protein LPJ53_002969 [Coemansia erecta]
MSSVTSSRVTKGGDKFVPKAKPRPARRPPQPPPQKAQPRAAAAAAKDSNPVDDDDRAHSGDSEQEKRQKDGNESDNQSVPEQPSSPARPVRSGATVIGIPSIMSVSRAPNGIPTVGSSLSPHSIRSTLGASAGASSTREGHPSRPVPPRLNLHGRRPSVIITPGSVAPAALSTQRLASLSSPISPRSIALSARQPSRSRVTSPNKRPRMASKTPEPRPMLQFKTPDDYACLSAEEINNLPMAYFCRDTRHGRPTAEFIERENEVIRKINSHSGSNSGDSNSEATPAPAPAPASVPVPAPILSPVASKAETPQTPVNRMAAQVRIVDGKVVIDTDSLVINRRDMTAVDTEPLEVVDESTKQRFTNSLTYVTKRTSRKRWKPEETELFYQALRKHGSDFQMIAEELPNRNRYDVRNKFKYEERACGSRITATLLCRDRPVFSPISAQPPSAGDGPPGFLESYSMAATPNPDADTPMPESDGGVEQTDEANANSGDNDSEEASNQDDEEELPEPEAVVGEPPAGSTRTLRSSKKL